MPERPPQLIEQRPVTNVLELLDRILDKGVVIMGDIRISVANIELLTVQIRLLIASVDKAKEIGVDFGWANRLFLPKETAKNPTRRLSYSRRSRTTTKKKEERKNE
jgi:hypothetical protein